MGRTVEVDPNLVHPKDHKVKGKANEIALPFTEHFSNPEEEEQFKLLSELEIRNMGSGYTCFANSFMFFTADREVKMSKSPVIRFFDNVNSIEKFEALGLPIKKKSSCSDGTKNHAYEFDLSQTKKLKDVLKIKKLDCLPVLWVFSTPSYTKWSVRFEQRLACKYIVMKLIDSVKNSSYDNNIDMYNL